LTKLALIATTQVTLVVENCRRVGHCCSRTCLRTTWKIIV